MFGCSGLQFDNSELRDQCSGQLQKMLSQAFYIDSAWGLNPWVKVWKTEVSLTTVVFDTYEAALVEWAASPPQVEESQYRPPKKISIFCFSRASNIYIRFICKTNIKEVNIEIIVTEK